MASDIEPLKYKKWVLKVLIHCHGCKEKVKKVLHKIEGVYKTMVDSNQHKVTIIGDIDVETLIKKLAKNGKPAEIWPETPQPKKEKVKEKKKDKEGEKMEEREKVNEKKKDKVGEKMEEKEKIKEKKKDRDGEKVEEKEKGKKKIGNDTPKSNTNPPKSKDNKKENQTIEGSNVTKNPKENPEQKTEEKQSGSKQKATKETDDVADEATGGEMALGQQKKKKQQQQFTSLVILPPPICGLSYNVVYPSSGCYWYYTSPATPVIVPTTEVQGYQQPMATIYYGYHHQMPPHCCVYSSGCGSSVFSDENVAGCHVM